MTALTEAIIKPGDTIRFRYTNWQMETEWRTATVEEFWFGSSSYHGGSQWFMRAVCQDRKAQRNFALRDMTDVSLRQP